MLARWLLFASLWAHAPADAPDPEPHVSVRFTPISAGAHAVALVRLHGDASDVIVIPRSASTLTVALPAGVYELRPISENETNVRRVFLAGPRVEVRWVRDRYDRLDVRLLGSRAVELADEVLRLRTDFLRRWNAAPRIPATTFTDLRPLPLEVAEYAHQLRTVLRDCEPADARILALLSYFEIRGWRFGPTPPAVEDERLAAELIGRLALEPSWWSVAPDALAPAVAALGGSAAQAHALSDDPRVLDAVETSAFLEAWARGELE